MIIFETVRMVVVGYEIRIASRLENGYDSLLRSGF